MEETRMEAAGLRPFPARAAARLGGAFYLAVIVLGLFGEAVVRGRVVVSGDAAATAQRLSESVFLWRLGVAGELLLLLCAAGVTVAWYLLFRVVNRELAVFMAFLGLLSIAVESVGAFHLQSALTPLSSAAFAGVQDPGAAQAQAYLAVVAHGQTFGIALIFFGVECLVVGQLIRKSGFVPGTIGILMQVAGLCYLVNSFSLVLHPPLARLLFPAILLPALVAEASLCGWMLFKGVDEAAWRRRVG
ncbi:DUF4386 domain-containing protein [Massilia niastensis]|uniref:DUF4386 domain-containing protein n=1 Tax=Massilia niastensis TaxID=544911 RepID=UPI0003A7EB9D|nr:DUF4386 domain-containing protein [Massilia niastensis]